MTVSDVKVGTYILLLIFVMNASHACVYGMRMTPRGAVREGGAGWLSPV